MRGPFFVSCCLVLALASAGLGYCSLPVARSRPDLPDFDCARALRLAERLATARLRACTVDLRFAGPARSAWQGTIHATLRPSPDATGTPWFTRDPDVIRRVAQIPPGADQRRRYVERHHDELVFTRDVDVRFEHSLRIDQGVVLDAHTPSERHVFSRALLPFPLIGLVLLVWQQRRWRKSPTAPTRF